MRVAARLRTLEAKGRPEDAAPAFLIVFEEADGRWHDGRGPPIDQGAINPRTQLIVFGQRADGPT